MRKLKKYQKYTVADTVVYAIAGFTHLSFIKPSFEKIKKQPKVINKIACAGIAIANVVFAIATICRVVCNIWDAEYLNSTFGYDNEDEEDDDDDLEMEDKDLDDDEEPVEEKVGTEPEAATAEE